LPVVRGGREDLEFDTAQRPDISGSRDVGAELAGLPSAGGCDRGGNAESAPASGWDSHEDGLRAVIGRLSLPGWCSGLFLRTRMTSLGRRSLALARRSEERRVGKECR